MSKHLTEVLGIKNYNLARMMASLRYDGLISVLSFLARDLGDDAKKDADRGRKKLAAELQRASVLISQAVDILGRAWEICKKHNPNC